MEKETKIVKEILARARLLHSLLLNASDADLIAHADDFLLFLNHLADLSKRNLQFASKICSLNDIIKRLESNPDKTICRHDVQERLLSFFDSILRQ